MAYHLIRLSPFPPGGFIYVQDGHKFKTDGSIQELVNKVLGYRLANKKPRATYHEVFEDVDVFNCQRFGNDPKYCSDSSNQSYDVQQPASQKMHKASGCGGCGAQV